MCIRLNLSACRNFGICSQWFGLRFRHSKHSVGTKANQTPSKNDLLGCWIAKMRQSGEWFPICLAILFIRIAQRVLAIMPSRTRRTVFSLVVFFSACGLAGMVVSQRVGAQSSTDESQFRDSLKSFTSVYDVVAQNYAEPLDGDKPDKAIYDGAIPGMLRVLDPHSNFYDPKAYAKMKEDQHGKYYGVGMTIQPQSVGGVQRVVVLYPYEGTPSYKAGVRPGDVIISVDGKTTDNLNSEEVANMLKGPKGTHVHLTVSREGASAPLAFDLVRD